MKRESKYASVNNGDRRNRQSTDTRTEVHLEKLSKIRRAVIYHPSSRYHLGLVGSTVEYNSSALEITSFKISLHEISLIQLIQKQK